MIKNGLAAMTVLLVVGSVAYAVSRQYDVPFTKLMQIGRQCGLSSC